MLGRWRWTLVVGLFDPLTAEQAQRLADIDGGEGKIIVIVTADENALLPEAARAQMVAALRSVSAVAIAKGEEWREWIPANADVVIVDDAAAEQERSAEFVKFVLSRQDSVLAGGSRK